MPNRATHTLNRDRSLPTPVQSPARKPKLIFYLHMSPQRNLKFKFRANCMFFANSLLNKRILQQCTLMQTEWFQRMSYLPSWFIHEFLINFQFTLFSFTYTLYDSYISLYRITHGITNTRHMYIKSAITRLLNICVFQRQLSLFTDYTYCVSCHIDIYSRYNLVL